LIDALKEPSTRNLRLNYDALTRNKHPILAFAAAQRVLERRSDDLAAVTTHNLLATTNELTSAMKIVDEMYEFLLPESARESDLGFCSRCATVGLIVDHEVLNAMSETLIRAQFLVFGSMEGLPLRPIEFMPHKDDSNWYRRVLADAQQEVMQNLHYSTIGAARWALSS
jgi:hypothetical protein